MLPIFWNDSLLQSKAKQRWQRGIQQEETKAGCLSPPRSSDNQAKRGKGPLPGLPFPGPIATPLLRVPVLLCGTGGREDGGQIGNMEKLSEEGEQELA